MICQARNPTTRQTKEGADTILDITTSMSIFGYVIVICCCVILICIFWGVVLLSGDR